MLRPHGRRVVSVATCLLVLSASFAMAPASAAGVQVVVNGQPMQFAQPPIERAGRILVPLRGVFEQLGASVAYQSGFIAATSRNGRTVSMTIGSRNATVDGNPTTLDVAPFTLDGRTLVPLRFVSTALGASVDYDAATQVATISNQTPAQKSSNNTKWILPAVGAAALIAIIAASSHHSSGFSLNSESPASGAVIPSTRPTISGNFSQQVDPYSVAIMLDGNDQTSLAYIAPNNFNFTPNYDLGQGNHTVRVTGRTQGGSTFDQNWSFGVSGYSYGGNGQNYINNVYPGNGSTVGGSFAITGTTSPNARVVIAITSVGRGFFHIGNPTSNYSTNADSRGRFYQNVNVQSGIGDVRVQITSTAPYSNASTGTSLTYHT